VRVDVGDLRGTLCSAVGASLGSKYWSRGGGAAALETSVWWSRPVTDVVARAGPGRVVPGGGAVGV